MAVSHLRGKIAALIAFTVVCLLLFVYLFTQAGGRIRLNQPYTLNALVPDALNIVNNSDVRRDGVKIGRIRAIEPTGGVSKLTFEIEDADQANVYRDATVRVRTKTLVGESYLDLDPGTRSAGRLADKATVPLSAADEVVPLERILNSLDEETRQQVRNNLKGLGVGLDGNGGNLNRVFGAVKPVVVNGGKLTSTLLPQKEELAALIDNTGVVTEALGERTAAFRSLAVDAKKTAEAVIERDDKLRESLKELPATLDQAQSSVNTLATFSANATPTVRSLKLSSRELGPALRDLGPTARSARTLFAELTPFLAKANPLLDELPPATKKLRKLVPALDATLRQAGPTTAFLQGYTQEFGSFFSNIGTGISSKDALGFKGRVFAMIGPNQITNLTPDARAVFDAITGGLTGGRLKTRVNQYPKSGTAGAVQPFDGTYPTVSANPPSVKK